MLRLRSLGSPRLAALLALWAFACAPIAGCGSSTDTGTGDDDTGTTDDGGDTSVSPDTSPKDTSTTDGGTDTTTPGDTSTADTTTSDTTATDTATGDTTAGDTATSDTTATDTTTSDTTATDTATDTPTDSATCPAGTRCALTGGANGICAADGATCAACVDPTDDGKCATAYGAGNICVGGACTPGNCHGDSACSAPTPTCGFLTANTCGGCTSDAQCTTAGQICNTTSGLCVSNACTGASASTCTANAADICCATTSGGTPGICVGGTSKASGGCCYNSDCTGAFTICQKPAGATGTSAGVCTACTVPTTGIFFVDPVGGSDTTGVGASSGGAACAFKTVTRALAFVGATSTNVTILVKGGSTLATGAGGETLPINIRANITIKGDTGGATLVLPAGGGGGGGATGFAMNAANSSLQNFTIDGGAHVGGRGVIVNSGASPTTTTISGVTIKNTLNEGILVGNLFGGGGGGGVTIGAGTSVTGAGTTAAPRSGLRVQGSSTVNVTGAAGSVISFSSNSQHGIEVDNSGVVNITGTPGSTADTGTVIANANNIAGLFVNQNAGIGTLSLNTINGLVVFGTTAGNGIRIAGGSHVKIRNSSSLGNSGSGIHISTGAGAVGSSDVTNIDLGKAGDFGGNTVQAPTTAGGPAPNGGAGICLELAGAASTVSAQGNKFAGAVATAGGVNCATATAGTKLKAPGTCGGGGGKNDVGSNNATLYKVDVTNCSYP